MDPPLKISGVGDGVQECKWETTTPVAIPTEDGTAVPFDLQMPIVTGSGSHLPIIVGLKTMSAKNGVLEMGPGKEFLNFQARVAANWSSHQAQSGCHSSVRCQDISCCPSPSMTNSQRQAASKIKILS